MYLDAIMIKRQSFTKSVLDYCFKYNDYLLRNLTQLEPLMKKRRLRGEEKIFAWIITERTAGLEAGAIHLCRIACGLCLPWDEHVF